MTSEGEDARLVGRTATLAAVCSDLMDVGPGGTAAVFVTGESGVGKSRLLREAAEAMRAGGAAVLAGACLDIGDASPLHPVLQALRRLGPDAGGVRVRTPAPCSSGCPASCARWPAIAVCCWSSTTCSGPTAAPASCCSTCSPGWATYACRCSPRSAPSRCRAPIRCGGYSPNCAGCARSGCSIWPRSTVTATHELVTAIAGTQVEPEDADRVFKRSGGNPFVVEELARDLRDGRVELSDTLREIFLSRVDELPPNAHAVVHAVAAGVEPVEHAVLARVLPLAEEQLIDAIRAAIAHRFVASAADGYRLRHRLVAEVLEHEVLPAEQTALHRRYAEALEAAGSADHARLARHWQQAGEPQRALPSVIAAARAAERLYGFAEAHRYWTLALELTADDADERTDLLAHAAESAHQCGEHLRALSRLEELAARPGGPGPCEIHLRRARYLAAAGRSATAETEYESALAAPGCTPREKATAAAYLAELLLHLGRYEDAGIRAREALELAEQVDGSTADLVRASAALGFSSAFRADPDAGLAVIRHAVEIAERSGHPDDVGCAYLHLAELLTGPLNSLEEGVLVARRGAAKLAELGVGRTYQTRLLAIAANGLFRVGQWAEAEKVLDDRDAVPAVRRRRGGAAARPLPALGRLRRRGGGEPGPGRGGHGAGRWRGAARAADADAAGRAGHVAGPARRGAGGGPAWTDRDPLRRPGAAGRAGLARVARRGGGTHQRFGARSTLAPYAG